MEELGSEAFCARLLNKNKTWNSETEVNVPSYYFAIGADIATISQAHLLKNRDIQIKIPLDVLLKSKYYKYKSDNLIKSRALRNDRGGHKYIKKLVLLIHSKKQKRRNKGKT